MKHELYPVPCPECGEAQNAMPGGFSPEKDPFGPVSCMVCGHQFNREEYLVGLAQVTVARRRAAASNVVPFKRG